MTVVAKGVLGPGTGMPKKNKMKDTTPEVEARYLKLLMQKTPQERLKMALEMRETAKEWARAGIRARLGDIDEAEMRVQLFRQFYGTNFTPERKARIEAGIRARAEKKPWSRGSCA